MTEAKTMPTEPRDNPNDAPPPPSGDAPAGAPAASPTRRIVQVTLGVLVALFVYHLFADRFTPYTSQATVDTFLVQIAPEVSGPVVTVGVRDNRPVKKGQLLFRIDASPFEIALRSAEANLAVATQGADASAADVRVADAQLRRSSRHGSTWPTPAWWRRQAAWSPTCAWRPASSPTAASPCSASSPTGRAG